MSDRLAEYLTVPLGKEHDRAAFSCGKEPLDIYLKRHVGQDARRNLARTFVTVGNIPEAIAGFYTLSTIGILLDRLPEEQRSKLPRYPELPGALIGRLAVDREYHGRRLGEVLLVDALRRICASGREVAVYAVIVDAIDDEAASFYEKYGFKLFPSTKNRLFLPIRTAFQLFE